MHDGAAAPCGLDVGGEGGVLVEDHERPLLKIAHSEAPDADLVSALFPARYQHQGKVSRTADHDLAGNPRMICTRDISCNVVTLREETTILPAGLVLYGSGTEGARTRLMPRALETDGLPIVLAMALWPWIDAIEAAACDASETLRLAAERAARDLRHLIVITAPLETMLEDALQASRRLADIATQQALDMPYVRMEALLTLNDLIAWLRRAKPSEWAEVTGISW